MPRGGNIAARNALKREKKEAKSEKNAAASLIAAASRSLTSPLDLSEPHANADFLDIPCSPVARTTPAAAEAFETPAATLTEAGAVELPPSADDDAKGGQDRPKRARKSSDIMNVGEFPTNFKRGKKEEVVVSTDTLGNAIYDEQILVEEISAMGCPGCGKHSLAFNESVARGLGGHIKFTCSNKKCAHVTKINKSKMIPTTNAAGKPGAPKSANTLRGVVGAKTAGIGHTQLNHCLLSLNMRPLNTNVWAAHG